jgi:hypothetical protein
MKKYNFLNFKDYLNEITLQYHDILNPKIWDKKNLHKDVKRHLLDIAEAWRDFSNIPKNSIKDIVLTGGNANYNYTDYSDLDVHLLVDKNKIADCEKTILDDYLKDKKALWALNHNITVKGYDVEVYAQDINEPTPSEQGVYSLKNNKWIKEPKKKKLNLEDPYLKKKINNLKNMIDFFINSHCNDVEKMQKFKEKIRSKRSSSVQSVGEFGIENLAFKELRNLGYLEKLSDYIKKVQDKGLSLK